MCELPKISFEDGWFEGGRLLTSTGTAATCLGCWTTGVSMLGLARSTGLKIGPNASVSIIGSGMKWLGWNCSVAWSAGTVTEKNDFDRGGLIFWNEISLTC